MIMNKTMHNLGKLQSCLPWQHHHVFIPNIYLQCGEIHVPYQSTTSVSGKLWTTPFVFGQQRTGCFVRPAFLSMIRIFFLSLIPLVGNLVCKEIVTLSFYLIAKYNEQRSPIVLTLTSCWAIANVGILFINSSCIHDVNSLPLLFVGPKD